MCSTRGRDLRPVVVFILTEVGAHEPEIEKKRTRIQSCLDAGNARLHRKMSPEGIETQK